MNPYDHAEDPRGPLETLLAWFGLARRRRLAEFVVMGRSPWPWTDGRPLREWVRSGLTKKGALWAHAVGAARDPLPWAHPALPAVGGADRWEHMIRAHGPPSEIVARYVWPDGTDAYFKLDGATVELVGGTVAAPAMETLLGDSL